MISNEGFFIQLLKELKEKIKVKRNSTIEEFLVLPISQITLKLEEYQFKLKILEELHNSKEIDYAILQYYTYMLTNIYEGYYDLGRKLAIDKIKGSEEKIKLGSVLPNQSKLQMKYDNFENQLQKTIISIYKRNINNTNLNDNQVLKTYILDFNEGYFNDYELTKIREFIDDNDLDKLNRNIKNENRVGRKLH